MSIFESLENLNVSEGCFDDIMDIVEEIISEVSIGKWTDAAKSVEQHRADQEYVAKKKSEKAKNEYNDKKKFVDNYRGDPLYLDSSDYPNEKKKRKATINYIKSIGRSSHAKNVSKFGDEVDKEIGASKYDVSANKFLNRSKEEAKRAEQERDFAARRIKKRKYKGENTSKLLANKVNKAQEKRDKLDRIEAIDPVKSRKTDWR